MEAPGDIRDDQTVASIFPTSGTVLLALRDILSAITRLVPDMDALRRGDLGRLRQIASLMVFAMMLLMRVVLGWRERAAAITHGIISWAERNLRHPPATWAAP